MMLALVTDAHFRMSVSLIRDLGEMGVFVVCAEYEKYADNAVGFASRFCKEKIKLDQNDVLNSIKSACDGLLRKYGEKPALFCIGAKTLCAVANSDIGDHAYALLPKMGDLDFLNDKQRVAELAESLSVLTPRSFEISSINDFEDLEYPLVIKPHCGEKFGLVAADRYKIAKNAKEASEAYAHFMDLTAEPPVVQQFIKGYGYGCSVVAKDGKVLAHIGHKRIREYPTSGGPSSCADTVCDDDMLSSVKKICEHLSFSGVAMFEFKESSDGKKYLLEVNPRVWGTYPLTRASKSNFAKIWYFASLGREDVEYLPPQSCRMIYYPADIASVLGYIRKKDFRRVFGVIHDLFSKKKVNGLFDKNDKGPYRRYMKNLFKR